MSERKDNSEKKDVAVTCDQFKYENLKRWLRALEHQRVCRLSKRNGALFWRYHKELHQINRQTAPSSWQNRSHQAVLVDQRHLPMLLNLEEGS